jgi:hypothetical protein
VSSNSSATPCISIWSWTLSLIVVITPVLYVNE